MDHHWTVIDAVARARRVVQASNDVALGIGDNGHIGAASLGHTAEIMAKAGNNAFAISRYEEATEAWFIGNL